MNHNKRIINDQIFKSIFTNNPNILSKLISDITKIPYSKLKNNIFISNNKLPTNKTKKYGFIVKFNNKTNIKINTKQYSGLKTKNLSYSFNLYSNNSYYDDNFLIIQINFNTFSNIHTNYIDIFELKNKQGIKYIDNFKIYTIDIVKCHKLYYNTPKTTNNIIKWGTFIYSKTTDKNITNVLSNTLTPEELTIISKYIKKETN